MRRPPAAGRRRSSGSDPAPTAFDRLKAKVLAVVAAVPEGRVTTYGMIGKHLGATARQVARVMSSLEPGECDNWFRVVGANGVVSTTKLGAVGRRQIASLRADGIPVTARNKVEGFDAVVWVP
jgi:methylated-DNA-protein-cysteine methyltransferase-like protein